jgi:hypothetical protein
MIRKVGGWMPRGANDSYWRAPGLPSLFKYILLDEQT